MRLWVPVAKQALTPGALENPPGHRWLRRRPARAVCSQAMGKRCGVLLSLPSPLYCHHKSPLRGLRDPACSTWGSWLLLRLRGHCRSARLRHLGVGNGKMNFGELWMKARGGRRDGPPNARGLPVTCRPPSSPRLAFPFANQSGCGGRGEAGAPPERRRKRQPGERGAGRAPRCVCLSVRPSACHLPRGGCARLASQRLHPLALEAPVLGASHCYPRNKGAVPQKLSTKVPPSPRQRVPVPSGTYGDISQSLPQFEPLWAQAWRGDHPHPCREDWSVMWKQAQRGVTRVTPGWVMLGRYRECPACPQSPGGHPAGCGE